MTAGADALARAVGRTRQQRDVLALAPAHRLAATLDRDGAGLEQGAMLPWGWHWLYFLEAPPTSAIVRDGRSVPGGFLPQTGLARRMWAGGSFAFQAPLLLGDEASASVTLTKAARKRGRSGALAFLTTEHRIAQAGRAAVVETRELVFREAPPRSWPAPSDESPRPDEAAPPRPAPPAEAVWRRRVEADPVLLFRFSALTFNAHRIHYDLEYCRQQEGYPGLVVHGPLLALLLLDLARRIQEAGELPQRPFARFRYRASAPLFAPATLALAGCPRAGGALLWAAGDDGAAAMTAELELAGLELA